MKRFLQFAFLFVLLLVPSTLSEAKSPAVPSSVKVVSQIDDKLSLQWKFSKSIQNAWKQCELEEFGYNILLTDKNGKTIQKYSFAQNFTNTKKFNGIQKDKVIVSISNKALASKPVYLKIRSYVVDRETGKRSNSSYKKILYIPRPTITAVSCERVGAGRKITIKWSKISGASSYTVYMSGDGGKTFNKMGNVTGTTYTTPNPYNPSIYAFYVQANGVKVGSKKYSSTKVDKANVLTVKVN